MLFLCYTEQKRKFYLAFLSELQLVWYFIDHKIAWISLRILHSLLLYNSLLLLKHQLANALWNSNFCGEKNKNKAAVRVPKPTVLLSFMAAEKKKPENITRFTRTSGQFSKESYPQNLILIKKKRSSWLFLEHPSLNLNTWEWQHCKHMLLLYPLQVTKLWNQIIFFSLMSGKVEFFRLLMLMIQAYTENQKGTETEKTKAVPC